MLKRVLIGGLILVSLVLPSSATATTDDGTCRRLAREQGITYRGSVEMNLMGCVYSRKKGYYVPRSNSCNLRARNVTQKYPYPRNWEVARRIAKYCVANDNGTYVVR